MCVSGNEPIVGSDGISCSKGHIVQTYLRIENHSSPVLIPL